MYTIVLYGKEKDFQTQEIKETLNSKNISYTFIENTNFKIPTPSILIYINEDQVWNHGYEESIGVIETIEILEKCSKER
jgi:tRNA G10  N-methylase Trm11